MVGDGQLGVGFQLVVVGRLAVELPVRGQLATLIVHLPHPLYHLEQPCPTSDAILLQRGGYGQADGLLGAAFVSHYQVGSQWVKPTLHTLHRGVERLEVDGYVCPFVRHIEKDNDSFMVLL